MKPVGYYSGLMKAKAATCRAVCRAGPSTRSAQAIASGTKQIAGECPSLSTHLTLLFLLPPLD